MMIAQDKFIILDWTELFDVGIDNPPMLKTDTQRQKVLTKQFLLIKKVQACAHSH
jgi:hypothetical protein